MRRYGIPYMGSKNSILESLCAIFPKSENFYDVFGGGFSVTHFMLENRIKDYKEFHFNEIRKGVPELIQNAIDGKYSYENFKPEFINRNQFFKRIEEPYIKIIWSFGNNGKDYLFSKEIEPYKKSMHNAIVFNEFNDLAFKVFGFNKFDKSVSIKQKRLFLRSKIETYRLNGIPKFLHGFLNEKQIERLSEIDNLEQLEQLQQLEQLERLQQLERLKRLQQLERLHFYNVDYREIKIKENSIIYCDPPYIGTTDYGNSFNHKEFYNWADAQSNPVFISEYKLDDDRFKCVFKINKRSKLAAKTSEKSNNIIKEEKVFVNKAGFKALLNARRANV